MSLFANASLRGRLLVWIGVLLAAVLVGFGVTAYQFNRRDQLERLDQELFRKVAALARDVRGPGMIPGFPFSTQSGRAPREPMKQPFRMPGEQEGQPNWPPPGFQNGDRPLRETPGMGFRQPPGSRKVTLSVENAAVFSEAERAGVYYTLWSREGGIMAAASHIPVALERPPLPENNAGILAMTHDVYREAYYFTERGDCILVGAPLAPLLANMQRFALWLAVAGATVLVIGVGGAGWLISRAVKPVEQIAEAATRISQGNLSERINARGMARELAGLAGVLNTSFGRLEAAFTEQKRFTADASHELRTPLAVMIMEAQATLARERPAADYRDALEGCLDSAQQMRRLTDSLLQFARFDAGQEGVVRASMDLADVGQRCVEHLRSLAQRRGIEVSTDLAPASLTGDETRLAQVVTNLVQNAIHYNVEQGRIWVSTRTENGQAVLTVTDTGQGISEEDLPHVFERFFRADRARSRAEGRSGLGLAIAQTIAQAHGGTLTVTSELGVGSTFILRLPVAER